ASHKIHEAPKANRPVLIVGAGPTVNLHKHLDTLGEWVRDTSHNITIIATDRMLVPLIEHGIYPDYAITVDGNREKIVKWYDSPHVQSVTVREGVILSNTSPPNVAKLLMERNIPIYWF